MKPNCRGCEHEHEQAIDYVKEGLHIANMKDREFRGKGHLVILIVDDDGIPIYG